MAKIDIGKNLKNTLQSTMDSVKSSVKDVKLPELKVPEVKIPEQVKEVFKKKEVTVPEQSEECVVRSLSTRNAIKIIYYLMAVDGEVYHSEEEKFDLICSEIDPEFAQKKEQIIAECRKQLDKIIDSDDYYDVIQDGVEDAIHLSVKTEDTFITPKLLVWDLLTIAYSNGNYDEAERKLLKYIVRKLDIDKAVFLEMESSILTLMDLEKEIDWIKTTDRPYLTIEAMVNEIQDRKSVIFESVKDLILL